MSRIGLKLLLSVCFGFVVACASQGGESGSGDTSQDVVQDLGGSTTGQGSTGTTDEGVTDTGTTDEGSTDGQQTNTDPGSMSLLVRAMILGQPLVLGQAYEAGGQKFDLNMFRYWLSNVVLISADGSNHVVSDSYYLMEKTASKTREEIILGDIPAGDYTGIKFAVGVDPGANSSLDLFAGELTTAVNMDWGWKNGFVFFKIEGSFVTSGSTKAYRMHINTNANFKEIQLSFAAPVRVDGAHETDVAVDGNLEKVYESIDLATHPVTTYQSHSAQIAGGYAAMFTVSASASTPK